MMEISIMDKVILHQNNDYENAVIITADNNACFQLHSLVHTIDEDDVKASGVVINQQ